MESVQHFLKAVGILTHFKLYSSWNQNQPGPCPNSDSEVSGLHSFAAAPTCRQLKSGNVCVPRRRHEALRSARVQPTLGGGGRTD